MTLPVQALRLTYGPPAIELAPREFKQLVTQHDLYVIHAHIGVAIKWELYLTVSGGFVFITELEDPWRDIPVHFVARKVRKYLKTLRRAGAEAVLGILAALGGTYVSSDDSQRAACAPGGVAVIPAEDFKPFAPKMLYIVRAAIDKDHGKYGYVGTFDHEMSYIADGPANLVEADFEALGIHILYR
jgi:hypothetical protein